MVIGQSKQQASDPSHILVYVTRWDEKAGLRTGCGVRSLVIDALEAQEIKETGNEEGEHRSGKAEQEYFSTETDDRIGSGRSQQLTTGSKCGAFGFAPRLHLDRQRGDATVQE